MSEADLTDRVAIVTGASRGIGSAIADALVERGAKVVLSSRKQADLDAEAERLNAVRPDAATAVAAHAGKPEELKRLVDATLERHGRIDILVNNAATNPYFGHTVDADLGAWDKTFEVNVRGVFALTQLAVNGHMGEHGGAIVNVASVGGIRAAFGLGIYNITKAAVIHMTRQLALELGPRGIRVNAVAPGLIKTRFAEALWGNEEILNRVLQTTALGRIGSPPEIGRVVAFLASDEASFMTGEVVVIDGGGGAGH
ncbi:MAG: SDR family oxidoreductase [Candidatus Dormibacteraeota bacterium]|nr:SDR family oxidoreductase [Candidatus Dormibacteraeota bacterium]